MSESVAVDSIVEVERNTTAPINSINDHLAKHICAPLTPSSIEISTETKFIQERIEDINFSGQNVNSRALPKQATTYELENFEKNILLIFNHENVDGFLPRHGTQRDVEALTKTFQNFGFEIIEHKDKTKDEIFHILDQFAKRNFTQYGCVGVAVLTHGSKIGLLYSKDDQYSESAIIEYFQVYNKPTLVTKPKFLIIQACRGYTTIPGVPVFSRACKDLDSPVEPYVIPVEADLLILHSSYLGSPSNRHPDCGSWFIQSLCKKINHLSATHDLESIMTEVKRDVAIHGADEIYNTATGKMQVNKQMPVMTSTLLRKLYLKKYKDAPSVPITIVEGCLCDDCDERNENGSITTSDQQSACLYASQHLEYVLKMFRYYSETNPHDAVASSMYNDMNSQYKDAVCYSDKLSMIRNMNYYLKSKAKDWPESSYLYLYEYQCSKP